MHIVHISIRVKAGTEDAFIAATLENAQQSIQEPGIARFDFLRDPADATHFVLCEAYRTPQDQERHRETAHYLKWRDLVADMMAEPRVPAKYQNLFPADGGW